MSSSCQYDFVQWIINDKWTTYCVVKCHGVSSSLNRQEALLAAISEKDANIALLELSSSKKKKTQDEVALLKREKDRLVQQLKQQVGRGLKGIQDKDIVAIKAFPWLHTFMYVFLFIFPTCFTQNIFIWPAQSVVVKCQCPIRERDSSCSCNFSLKIVYCQAYCKNYTANPSKMSLAQSHSRLCHIGR